MIYTMVDKVARLTGSKVAAVDKVTVAVVCRVSDASYLLYPLYRIRYAIGIPVTCYK